MREPNVLLLCDRLPDPGGLGGTQLHAAALLRGSLPAASVSAAYPDGRKLIVLAPGSTTRVVAELPIGDPPPDPLSPWPAFARALEVALLAQAADVLSVQAPQLAPSALCEAIDNSGARVTITLHDHALVCENHELLEAGRRYCDLPADLARCDRCLENTRNRSAGHLQRWRRQQAELLDRCDVVIAPSDSVLRTVARVHPSASQRARRLDWGVPAPRVRCDPRIAYETPLRIAIVGLLAPVKGAGRLPELLAACGDLDVEWHLFGATEGRALGPIRSAARRVVVHGAYSRKLLAERLVRARCQIGLLPSIVPESFSLTLSELLGCGVPAIVSDLGAQKERVLADEVGWTFDPWRPETLLSLLKTLLADRRLVEQRMLRVVRRPHREEASMVRDHVEVWRELRRLGPRRAPKPDAQRLAGEVWLEAAPRPSGLLRATIARGFSGLRQSEWYRDLPLRRLLPETIRARAERALRRVL